MTQRLTPESAVNLIEGFAKAPPGYRRAHARGLVLRGTFTAAPEARALTTAWNLQGAPVPCLVRFSNASGHPCTPDRNSDTEGRVLGMAIRFEPPSSAGPASKPAT